MTTTDDYDDSYEPTEEELADFALDDELIERAIAYYWESNKHNPAVEQPSRNVAVLTTFPGEKYVVLRNTNRILEVYWWSLGEFVTLTPSQIAKLDIEDT